MEKNQKIKNEAKDQSAEPKKYWVFGLGLCVSTQTQTQNTQNTQHPTQHPTQNTQKIWVSKIFFLRFFVVKIIFKTSEGISTLF